MGVSAAYSIRSLKHAYDRDTILNIPFMDIPEGSLCIISGPNGSGKSTLLSILALLQFPSAGSIHFSGVPCSADPDL
ncbi:MAG: ABC transporter ATP-binding protein [Acidobacteriota bacterium]